MTKQKHKGGLPGVVFLGLAGLALLIFCLLRGKDVALFNPKGQVAQGQAHLMMFSVGVLLAVAIPTLTLLYFFAWKYRETNHKPVRDTGRPLSWFSAAGLWVIPSLMILVLSLTVLPATYNLDPHKAIASDAQPLIIQVVALRWKWLFIYPEQGIATVNYIQIPVNTPVQFKLTADEAPMNSFWIPHLGGQLYAMTGHDNRINLMGDTTGNYIGQAAEINGPGFAGMKFTANVAESKDFSRWVRGVQQSSNVLSSTEYDHLLIPSESNPAKVYSSVDTNLYDTIIMKYESSPSQQMEMP